MDIDHAGKAADSAQSHTVDALHWVWDSTVSLANSSFGSALLGALGGAIAGAWIAQRIGENAKVRQDLIAEIRGTNATIALAFAVWNVAVNLKKQHIKPLHDDWMQQRENLRSFFRARNAGDIAKDVVFNFPANVIALAVPYLPVDSLQSHLFDKLTLTGRPLVLATAIVQAATSLRDAIVKRNELAQQLKGLNGAPEFVNHYFGVPDADGNINAEYAHTVEGMYRCTDDVIYFCELLCEDVRKHGDNLLGKLDPKRALRNRPRIMKPDFEQIRKEGLAPDEAKYASWRENFREQDSVKAGAVSR